jgi:outer membrane protein assembly factor BamB
MRMRCYCSLSLLAVSMMVLLAVGEGCARSGKTEAVVTAVNTATPGDFRPHSFDWPQWQGRDRNAVSHETGLLNHWPSEGPPLVWKVQQLGGGYSAPTISGGRIFGMSFRGDDEVVWALDEADGRELWVTRIAPANRSIGYGEGPRCSPTVDGTRLYALGVSGDWVSLDASTGKEQWHKSLTKDFGGHIPAWGYSESPLVDGDKVIATPGGSQATIVALSKSRCEVVWKAQVPEGDGAAYSSVIAGSPNGQREYFQLLQRGVVGIAAGDGKFLWRYDKPANGTANCSTPVYQDNEVFAASGYGTGGGAVKLERDGNEVRAEEVFFTKHMKNHHGGIVLVDGYLYGSNEGVLCCLDFKTGKVMWEDHHPGKGSIAYADGKLYYRNEGGPVFLVDANPQKYVQAGRFDQPERSEHNAWPHPILANGRLYLRDQDLLLCYDIKRHGG